MSKEKTLYERLGGYDAIAAATRVLCYWRDRVRDLLALLKIQVKDESPRVRLEAVRACSFFKTASRRKSLWPCWTRKPIRTSRITTSSIVWTRS